MLGNLLFERHIGHFINQYCKLVFGKNKHIGNILANSRTFTDCARLHPQSRKHFLELSAESNRSLIKESKLEKCSISFESLRHRLVTSKIITFKGIAFYVVSFDAAYSTRPCNVTGNAEFFPFFITGMVTTIRKRLCLIRGYLVICNHNTTAASTILSIEKIYSVKRSARTCKKVNYQGVRLIGNKESNRILYGIYRFGE